MTQSRDLTNLLNRAAAALETPADLTDQERQELIEDLTSAAEPQPVTYDSIRNGQFYRVTTPQFGADNNSEETTVPAGDIWKVEHVFSGNIVFGHPSGHTISLEPHEEWIDELELVTEPVVIANVRAAVTYTASRYVLESAEEDDVLKSITEDFIWDRNDPDEILFDGWDRP